MEERSVEVRQVIHLEGFIEIDQDGVSFKGDDESIASRIHNNIGGLWETSQHQPEDDYTSVASIYIPKVAIRMYFSDNQISLDEVTEKVILNTLGALDIYTEWYGYSEWTIMGYSVENFTVGNHNLEEILESYEGKYVHIVMEILE